jgi:hypothetical protein
MPIETDPTMETAAGTYPSGGTYPGGSGAGVYEGTPSEREEFGTRARQGFTDAYDRTSRKLNDTYRQVSEYGQDHPGAMTLIAFGAGIGTGLLLSSLGSRSRTERILNPILSAVADVAKEVLR